MNEQATGRRTGRATRKIKWLGVAVLVVIGAYTALWFFLAGRLDDGVARAIAQAEANGADVTCENRDVRGYPFRLGLFCEDTELLSTQARAEAGSFRSAAQIYRPGLVISELDGPLAADLGGGRIEADWDLARASTRFGTERLQLGTVELNEARFATSAARAVPVAGTLGRLVASIRPNGEALDAAVTATGLDLEPVAGRDAPPLDLDLDATLSGAGAALAYQSEPLESLRGRTIALRRLSLGLLDGGRVTASGNLDVDARGLVSGELDVSFSDLAATLETLATLLPELAPQIDAIRPVLGQAGGGFLGNLLGGGDDAPDDGADAGATRLTIALDGGRARVGVIPIGSVPPLP